MKSGIAFHVHHTTLYEPCFDFDERIKYIKENKPSDELKLRLRLFKLIPKDRLPGKGLPELQAYEETRKAYEETGKACDKAGKACLKACPPDDKARQAYGKARKGYDKARQAYDKARKGYDKAWQAYDELWGKEIETLHKELCLHCPWNGYTIFTRKDKDGTWY